MLYHTKTYEVSNVVPVRYNGRTVRMFDVWSVSRGAKLFIGTYTAPVRTAKKRLLQHVFETQQANFCEEK